MEQVKVQPLYSPAKSPKRPPPPPLAARVRVAVRVRPPVISERDEPTPLCVTEADPATVSDNMLHFQLEKTQKAFRFDHVFSAEAQQPDVYNLSLQPLLTSLLHGFNVTVLAYGQTGSGKTYTMGGTGNDDGLISRFLRDLFNALRNEASMKTTANVSFLEIYCDEIRDLLVDEQARNNSQNNIRMKLTIHEDDQDVWVEGLQKVKVKRVGEALNLLKTGRQRQTIGAHAVNDSSSRSHAVFTLDISRVFANEIKGAKLTFVDLAGSERVKKTLMDGQGMKEGSHINIGLLALGNVINALGSRQRNLQRRTGLSERTSISGVNDTTNAVGPAHVPYRSSKLTRLLRDALGGNSMTLFIACISPETTNGNETLCTLQYANRARSIQNKAQKNVEEADSAYIMDDAIAIQHATETEREIYNLRAQVASLKLQLEQAAAAAKAVDIGDSSRVEAVQSVSEFNQANAVASKAHKPFKPRRRFPLDLDMSDLQAASMRDTDHSQAAPTAATTDESTNQEEEKASPWAAAYFEQRKRHQSKQNRGRKLGPAVIGASLTVTRMTNFKDNSHSLESEQRGGIVNTKTQQFQQESFFIDSTLSDATDQTESEEEKPQPPTELIAPVSEPARPYTECNACHGIVPQTTSSIVIPSSRIKDVIAGQTVNQSPGSPIPNNNLRDVVNQSTQYEFPLCLQNERKMPVDYVLLSPSQIFREVHHQRQKAVAGARSLWPHKRRLVTPHSEPRYSPSALVVLDTNNNNTLSKTSATNTNTLDVFQDLLQRTRQLIEDSSDPDSKPEVDDPEQKQEQRTPLSLNMFVDRMTALYDQRSRQQQFVHRLRQRYRHLATLLGVEDIDYQMNELSRYTLEHQQGALLQQLEACELLAAERLWIRLQHREVAIDNYAGVWNEKLEKVFLTDDQYEACTPWHSHREDHEFFRRHILPFILNDWIAVTPADLDNEQLWLAL